MPDLKDARQELGQALGEAGALPQWEDVTFDGAPHCNLQRIRVENGWIYGTNRCPQVFVPDLTAVVPRARRAMRDPGRIDGIIERLRAFWQRHPYLRLGQLVANGAKFGPDIPVHIIEDDALIDAIEQVHT